MSDIFSTSFVSGTGYNNNNEPKLTKPFRTPTVMPKANNSPKQTNNNKSNQPKKMNPFMEGVSEIGGEMFNAAKDTAKIEAIKLARRGAKYALNKGKKWAGEKAGQYGNRQRTSSPGSGKGRGNATKVEYDRPERISVDLNKTFSIITGFQVNNTNGACAAMSSPSDTSLYENAYRVQETPAVNGPVYARTALRLVNWDPFNGNYSASIMQDIFGAFKQEVNSATNGGNTVTDTKFTETNFVTYITQTWRAYMMLMELMSRQAWSSPSVVGNNVLKKVAYSLTEDTAMITARNSLAEALSNLCLTQELINYGQWLTQVYKSNDHDYAIDQLFASQPMNRFMATQNVAEYVGSVATITTALRSNIALNSQISALLQTKTTSKWVSLRNVPVPCNSSIYDISYNDIWQNAHIGVPLYSSLDNEALPPALSDAKSIAPCCFQNDVNSTPVHVTETICHRWVSNSPLLFTLPIVGETYGQRYVMTLVVEDPTLTNGFKTVACAQAIENITDSVIYPIRLATTSLQPGASFYDYIIRPKGNQSFFYDPALEACSYAKRILAAKLFS
jgi:hypothetical protein